VGCAKKKKEEAQEVRKPTSSVKVAIPLKKSLKNTKKKGKKKEHIRYQNRGVSKRIHRTFQKTFSCGNRRGKLNQKEL